MLDLVDATTHFHVRQAPAYPQTIHEHRAPTDESVRMLRELEEAANKRWLERINVADNSISCKLHWEDVLPFGVRKVRAVLSINGKKIVVDSEIPFGIDHPHDRMKWMATEFTKLIGQRIAFEVLGPAIAGAKFNG